MGILETRGWELESAEERHSASPASFEIPSLAERSSLVAGQMVKLLFLFRNEDENGEQIIDCERMWVTITDASAKRYSGNLESVPRTSDALRRGDNIQFSAEHVSAVFIPLAAPSIPNRSVARLYKWWRALVRLMRPFRRQL